MEAASASMALSIRTTRLQYVFPAIPAAPYNVGTSLEGYMNFKDLTLFASNFASSDSLPPLLDQTSELIF